jgi:hypothetical protein
MPVVTDLELEATWELMVVPATALLRSMPVVADLELEATWELMVVPATALLRSMPVVADLELEATWELTEVPATAPPQVDARGGAPGASDPNLMATLAAMLQKHSCYAGHPCPSD